MDLTKQQLLAGKYIIGIDPAKDKHQAIILDPDGLQLGKSLCFDVSYEGYTNILWKKITFLFPRCNPENTIFAIETSCPEGMDSIISGRPLHSISGKKAIPWSWSAL